VNELSDLMAADGRGIAAANSPDRVWAVPRRLEQAALIALQLLGLCALNYAGIWFARRTGLPVPGNLIGMVALYALLALGVVKVAWFDVTGSFLIKHLAFFFIPITVGLMNSGPLLLADGLGIMLILALSAAIGIILAGWVSQVLLRASGDVGGGS